MAHEQHLLLINRLGFHRLLKVIGCTCLLMLIACQLKAPQTPTWMNQINLPLIDKSIFVTDLVDDKQILIDSTGLLSYVSEQTISNQKLGDRLNVKPASLQKNLTIGEIHVPFEIYAWVNFLLKSIYASAEENHGRKIAIPQFDIQPEYSDLTELPVFRSMEVVKGTLAVQVQNNLDIPLGEPFYVTLMNRADSSIIGTVAFNTPVLSGQSIENQIPVQQRILTNQISVRISGISRGSDGKIIEVDQESEFQVSIRFIDVIAAELQSQIVEYEFSHQDVIELNDTLIIREAVIRAGEFDLNLRNDFDVRALIIIELPNIIRSDGHIFRDTLEIIPKQLLSRTYNLLGYRIVADVEDELENLRVSWKIKIENSNKKIFTLRSGEGVFLQAQFSKLYFDYLIGRLYRLPLPFPDITRDPELPAEIDSVRLAGAYLSFDLEYNFRFQMEFIFQVTAKNDLGDSVSLDITRQLPTIPSDKNSMSVHFKAMNVAPLFNIIPTEIKLTGQIQIGQREQINRINHSDHISIDFKTAVPFRFILPSQKGESETKIIDISDKIENTVDQFIQSGYITVKTINHLPFAPKVKMLFSNHPDSVYSAPKLTLGPMDIGRAIMHRTSGQVIYPVSKEEKSILSKDQFGIFKRPNMYVGIKIAWAGTSGRYIAVYANDYLYINAICALNVKIE